MIFFLSGVPVSAYATVKDSITPMAAKSKSYTLTIPARDTT